METPPVIIDFYGLPGCGKTTLCKTLINQYPDKVIDVDAVWVSYWTQNWFKRISEIPIFVVFKLFFLFLRSPKLSKEERNIYRGFFVHIISYSHFKRMNYKVLLSDNGLIQDLVSLFYKKESIFSKKHARTFSSLIKGYTNLNQVFCDIPVALSLERIRTRNRNKGRLDLIRDNKNLENALTVQSEFFQKMNVMLKSIGIDFYKIDMNSGAENVVEQVKILFPFLQVEDQS